jgi:hypothetical protein
MPVPPSPESNRLLRAVRKANMLRPGIQSTCRRSYTQSGLYLRIPVVLAIDPFTALCQVMFQIPKI